MHSHPAPGGGWPSPLPAALIAALAISVVAPAATAHIRLGRRVDACIGWINGARVGTRPRPAQLRQRPRVISGIARQPDGRRQRDEPHRRRATSRSQLDAYGVQWFRYGEDIGWSTASLAVDAAPAIFNRLDEQRSAPGD